ADRVSVILNGIPEVTRLPRSEARARLGLPDAAGFVVGAVGNLYSYKGHDLLLAAVARLLPGHPDLRVVIVGAGARTGEGGGRHRPPARAPLQRRRDDHRIRAPLPARARPDGGP